MDPVEAKIAGMICIGIGTLGVGLSPAWFSAHSQDWPLLISSMLCFGGGVLFSTAVIHILPELKEQTEYAELLLCSGFFLLYLIDEIVHYFWSDNGRHNHSHNDTRNTVRPCASSTGKYGSIETPLLSNEYNRPHACNPIVSRAGSRNDVYIEERGVHSSQPNHSCHVSHTEPCNNPPIGQMGLLIALSLHATLEGLAIGLEDKTSKVWLLLGAVASHKLVVGFCLGVELSSGVASSACKHFTAIIIFTLGSVVGIGLGMIITDVSSDWSSTVQPILQGMAAGTLLYVTMSEVLPRERAKWHNQTRCHAASLIQFFAVAIGFTMMTLITTYLDFDHN